ncbi:MAG: FAD-dependent oxidoreductase [Anaerovoracaceae bacterium]|jgi:NADPH-dependent 2,4-dienoyl-CoA reductase/sulfur reductase-like enzyme/peroxiredoxin family protein/TusA-related sulfurtransferase/rhodanese-related sulfurtransferase
MKTLIIGGVAGGASAAARLRRLDEKMDIVIVERGEYISYANCGLPYHVGDVIKEKSTLLLQTPQRMKERFNIDVRVNSEAISVDADKKLVRVRGPKGEYDEAYDELLLATGSSPLKPPIPGIDGKAIYTLWNVGDATRIRGIVDQNKPQTAAVIGGGFIGLEMAENLHKRGIAVSIIEAQDQVMAPLDFAMAQLLHENIAANGVALYLGDGVASFEEKDGGQVISLASGRKVQADMVILSIGVRPNSELAKAAGLELNERGGIKVDGQMRTSKPHIWAVGDVIEVSHRITGEKTMIQLAGPANKQGRIAADNICGGHEVYPGSMGTSVAQVFDMTAASTGLNEKTLKRQGKEKNRDYYAVVISQKSHAGYYPLAVPMFLKLIFDKKGKILGAQIVGRDGVDKRIDTIATALGLSGTVKDLKEMELAYAPPYSSAKDPVNMLGFTAENVLRGLARFVSYDELEGMTVLDVSEDAERQVFAMPGSLHIPLGQLRGRMDELPKDQPLAVYCAIGVRSYNAARILMQSGFEDVSILEGGSSFYRSCIFDTAAAAAPSKKGGGPANEPPSGSTGEMKILDCCGLQCPGPIMRVNETLNSMNEGETLRVSATDMGFVRDVESWCERTGNTFAGSEKNGLENIVTVIKGKGGRPAPRDKAVTADIPHGKTMVVFDGDLDRAMAAFIIANGAAAMGRPVTMFFTFWGLNILRRDYAVKADKSMREKMFSAMMPRGAGRLKLSRMNMMGMGTGMMKKTMKEKNVSSLQSLMKQAMDAGVKLVACTMTMDIMGIKPEELIDGVELGGVATYLGDAENADTNLFI